MLSWLTDNSGILVAELIGAVGTIIAVVITIKHENRRRRKELVYKAKPILINYSYSLVDNKDYLELVFESKDGSCDGYLMGSFKNTDNGILFLDYIETETKVYYPKLLSVVDKNTPFSIVLSNIGGETLKKCSIICHDIYENRYRFNAFFDCTKDIHDQIILKNYEPQKDRKKKNHSENK